MYLMLRDLVPADQLILVHAELPGSDWPDLVDHIKATTKGEELILARAGKTFLEMVERRGMFPSPSLRQCTSDLKRDPIARELRRFVKANPQFQGRLVNCMGIRAQESASRARKNPLKLDLRNSKAGREWWEWYPIFDMSEAEVFAAIEAAGQEPHWAYAAGMSRLSCCFCIMSSQADLETAARLRPDLLETYANLEEKIGHTMSMSQRPLREIVNAPKPCQAVFNFM
jgi:3'-phosphoadenosine 5'-phosphosulfate sulfotransferase (PAPS reductase)/FAD synthetase